MRIEIVRDSEADQLLAEARFRDAWSRLRRRCPWATSFQGVDFVPTWYRVYRGRFAPVLVLSRDANGELDGLLTLAASSDGELLVAGGAQAEYQAWLCAPDLSDTFVRQAVAALRQEFPRAVLTFRYLPPGTPTAWFATPEAARGCALAAHRRPLLRFGDGSDIAKSLTKKSNKSRLNRLEKIGPLEFKRVTDPTEFARICDDIIQSYDFRQAAVHGVAPFRDDDLKKAFHTAMMEVPGLLHVTLLKVGDCVAAAHLGVCGDREVQLGIIAHNPALAKHSPGKFHVLFLARMLREEGYEQLDLTPGGDPYKERFANGADQVHTLLLYLSSSQRVIDVIRTRVARAVKASLRSAGIAPERAKALGGRLLRMHPVGTPATWAKRVRQWIGRRCEVRVYSHEATGVPDTDGSHRIRCNAAEDLLRYAPAASDPPQREFLSSALQRMEDGLRIHTYAENGSLVCYGWLAERQERAFVSEVGQEFGMPENCAYLFDLYALPRARTPELFANLLRGMLDDAARVPGTTRVYVCVSAGDAPLQQAVERTGFAYEGSLFEQVRFGQARRWARLPARGVVVQTDSRGADDGA